ncbi:MAG: hypothetical protein ACI8SN_001723, partial [Algoriphagus sp.]
SKSGNRELGVGESGIRSSDRYQDKGVKGEFSWRSNFFHPP